MIDFYARYILPLKTPSPASSSTNEDRRDIGITLGYTKNMKTHEQECQEHYIKRREITEEIRRLRFGSSAMIQEYLKARAKMEAHGDAISALENKLVKLTHLPKPISDFQRDMEQK